MADKKKSNSPRPRRKRSAPAPATAPAAPPRQAEPQPPASPKPQERQTRPRALFSAPIAVRWRDLDAFNHVNNSNFLTYLEEARLQWLKDVPGPWFDAHSMPVLAAAELNYRTPIEWPASIVVELFCERTGNSSITIGHRIVDANDARKLYCDGHTVLVWTDPASGRSVGLPEAIRNASA
ncbi:MAG TPA: thioesterase family protein [Rhodanobacteraceae bacterium]